MGRNFIPTSFDFQLMRILPEIKVSELHDGIIVATAKVLNAKLITKDGALLILIIFTQKER